jgi:uncharacterized protein YdiU (UPF0061 family)
MLETTLTNSYGLLPAHFFSRIDPTQVASPRLIKFNAALAAELNLDLGTDADDLAAIFSGNRIIPGTRPIAMAYAGHQFGQFVPQLGDGRAILLGEARDRTGRRRDIQLKGSGRTPYSRSGDGRAALGPVLREYLVSEAMHALGVPATRALAAVTTGEVVFREARVPGAILTRVAASHVRVGTFQFFAARGDVEATRALADYVIDRHYADIASAANPYLALLRAVVRRQASLVARWMHIGFIHGVMNTDNMAISGETIDFGPCAFMDSYDPMMVFSSIDHRGRYAYANQPTAAQWNLARFAETLLPLIDPALDRAIELATEAVGEFSTHFEDDWLAGMRRKLGMFLEEDGDDALIRQLLGLMHQNQADFTVTFRRLCAGAESDAADVTVAGSFADAAAYGGWAQAWRARLAREPQPASERAAFMRLVNPAIIPRNHRIEQGSALARPYEDVSSFAAYASPPSAEERVLQTFCGT